MAPSVDRVWDSLIDSVPCAPERDDVAETEEDDRGAIGELGALWAVAERANSNNDEDGDVELEDNLEDDPACAVKVHKRERVLARVGGGGLDELRRAKPASISSHTRNVHGWALTKKKAR